MFGSTVAQAHRGMSADLSLSANADKLGRAAANRLARCRKSSKCPSLHNDQRTFVMSSEVETSLILASDSEKSLMPIRRGRSSAGALQHRV